MPIFIWIVAVVLTLAAITAIIWMVLCIRSSADDTYDAGLSSLEIAGTIFGALVALAIAAGSLYWLYGTAPGQRELKSFASETGGGLSRMVTVYDLQGDVLATYEGKFDVQQDDTRVFFDLPQADGSTKRVQIYNATVVVEEK